MAVDINIAKTGQSIKNGTLVTMAYMFLILQLVAQ